MRLLFLWALLSPSGFLLPPHSLSLGPASAVAVAPNGDIFLLHRGAPPIVVFDKNGNYLRGWGDASTFKVAHGLRFGPDGNLWTTDNGDHVLRDFSPSGQLLRTLGEKGVPGSDPAHFRSPDDLVFTSRGEIIVADAGNARLLRLDATGKFLAQWGAKGTAPGQFQLAHGLAIDPQDHLYVADRGNNRVQVFDPSGNLLHVWSGFGNPFGLLWTKRGLLVSDGDARKLILLDPNGSILDSWGDPSMLQLPHFMALDSAGRLLVTEVDGKRVQRLEWGR